MARLVRQEIALARAEVRHALRTITGAMSRVALGTGIAGVGALTLLAGIVVLIGELIGSYWLSAMIVGFLLLLAGGLAAFGGVRRIRSVDPTPRNAIQSAQETAQWARAEIAGVRARLLGRGGVDRKQGTAAPLLHAPGHQPHHAHGAAPAAGGSAIVPRAERAVTTGSAARPAGGSSRVARTPPPKREGLIPFLKHVGKEIQEDEVTGHAAKLAYYAFLAMPPALMALFGLAGLIGSERIAGWLEQQAALALPAAVSENIIGPFIEQVVLQEAPGPFSIGLLLALWGGSAVFAGLIDTLNHAYDVDETRSFLRKRALALVIMLGSALLFLAAAGALLVAPALVDALGIGRVGAVLWNVAQWPLAFAFMVGAFWCAYYFLPNRDQKASRWVLLRAAAVAAVLWVLATAAFRIYIANFSSYSETYGFLGAFIILLLWLYVTGLVVLVGGELASEMERRAS